MAEQQEKVTITVLKERLADDGNPFGDPELQKKPEKGIKRKDGKNEEKEGEENETSADDDDDVETGCCSGGKNKNDEKDPLTDGTWNPWKNKTSENQMPDLVPDQMPDQVPNQIPDQVPVHQGEYPMPPGYQGYQMPGYQGYPAYQAEYPVPVQQVHQSEYLVPVHIHIHMNHFQPVQQPVATSVTPGQQPPQDSAPAAPTTANTNSQHVIALEEEHPVIEDV